MLIARQIINVIYEQAKDSIDRAHQLVIKEGLDNDAG